MHKIVPINPQVINQGFIGVLFFVDASRER